MFHGIRAIMIFAEDPEKSARFWGGVLDAEVHLDVNDKNGAVYAWLDVADIEFGFHPLDEKNNRRGGSPVPYWTVDDVAAVRQRLIDAGCTHHRGPLNVADDASGRTRRIAQLADPFGNVIGIDGF
ncbi:VOC family protein [Streptomyces sp. NPDC058268]|uniref:VOC family protein n=1 Tax=Streptomyces sp. NPDC058268 TaxID=3346413 RepID=UPI0036EFE2AD